ncbi:MAG TPA: hypothetical protein VHW00_22785 [Thermoanaerobaculia bacterium]|nr:hypothetical protein [Thermoanaerobaculia bacterium]
MKRVLALGTFGAVVFLVFVGADGFKPAVQLFDSVPAAAPGDEPVTLQISVKPATEREYQLLGKRQTATAYFAEVVVLDESSRKIFGGASALVEPGTRETATGKLRDGEIALNVALDRGSGRALAEATVKKNGVVVQRQKTDVMLRVAPPQGNIPIQ